MKVVVVSVRPPSMEGTGDARRAANISAALRQKGAAVNELALLAEGVGLVDQLLKRPSIRLLLALARGLFGRSGLPMQVVLGHELLRKASFVVRPGEFYVFVTARVVPDLAHIPFAVDFVDSLAENAQQRARVATSRFLRWLWQRESDRMRVWEGSVAERAKASFCVSHVDASMISPATKVVPIDFGQDEIPAQVQPKPKQIIFPGSLFYQPNEEAALWIIRHLVPALAEHGVNPSDVVIAGRRPRRLLIEQASTSGVTLMADVPDLLREIASSAVVLAPIETGAGVQTKVLNAAFLGRPIVMTPRANRGLDFEPSPSVRVVERRTELWASEIVDVLKKQPTVAPGHVELLRRRFDTNAVRDQWAEALLPIIR